MAWEQERRPPGSTGQRRRHAHWLGRALAGVRAGADKLAIAQPGLAPATSLTVSSPAFADGAGVSPPLLWGPLPAAAATLALLVEDADAPTPQPLVHAVIWGIDVDSGGLAEGAIVADGDGSPGARDVGRNSFLGEGWLPPDPPPGHGTHRYCFQLFALDIGVGDPGASPGRSALIAAMRGHVLAAGVLVGTYDRGEEAAVGPTTAAVAAR